MSAKHSDGGVDSAIQALIRHLLERKLKDHARKRMEAVEVKRNQRKRLKVKKVNPDEFKPLDKVNVEEVRFLFIKNYNDKSNNDNSVLFQVLKVRSSGLKLKDMSLLGV